jgi:hypothetical protein
MKRKVMIGTPAYSGDVCFQYTYSLIQTFAHCLKNEIGFDFLIWPGNCYLDQVRDLIAKQFLESNCTDLLFIDADLGWDASAVAKIVECEKDVVAGLYPFKTEEEGFPARVPVDKNGMATRENGLVKLEGAPTGFLRIRREVLEKMIAAHPDWLVESFDPRTDKKTEYYHLFRCEQEGTRWWGEDYNFCRKWIELGGEVWGMPDINFQHVGRKAWQGNYNEFMTRQPGGSNEHGSI